MTDTELTSPGMTSSSSVAGTGVKSGVGESESAMCRQQVAPVMFGDLLSSVHKEVESTLRQLPSTDISGTGGNSGAAAALTAAGLSSTACMRDVCDAIIVQALQQCDDECGQQRPLDVASPQRLSGTTDSETRVVDFRPQFSESLTSESSDVQPNSRSAHFSKTWPTELKSRSMDSLQQQQQFAESHVTDVIGQQSRCGDSKSPKSRLSQQVSDSKDKQPQSLLTQPHDSRSSESRSCVPVSNVEMVMSHVTDAATANVADDDDNRESSDGDAKKMEADLSSHEADDVDIEDQPLCIDLNRDTSPDNEDDTVTHL